MDTGHSLDSAHMQITSQDRFGAGTQGKMGQGLQAAMSCHLLLLLRFQSYVVVTPVANMFAC